MDISKKSPLSHPGMTPNEMAHGRMSYSDKTPNELSKKQPKTDKTPNQLTKSEDLHGDSYRKKL